MIADQWLARPRKANQDADVSVAVAQTQSPLMMGTKYNWTMTKPELVTHLVGARPCATQR